MDNLTQDKIDKMMNHINSYSRKKLGAITPFEVFKFISDDEAVEKLNLKPVVLDEVMIHPRLIQD